MTHLEHFESIAPIQERQRRKQRGYYNQLRTWLRYVIPEGKSVLELGCADGWMLGELKPSNAVGIDFSQRMITLAREKHPNARFILSDIDKPLPSMAQTFDYVFALDLVGYLQDIQAAMEHVAKLFHPETRLIITKTNPFWGPFFRVASWLGLAQARRYSNWITRKQCEDLLTLAGFEIVQRGKFCLLPFNIPILGTIVNRYLARLPIIRRACLVETLICRLRPTPAPTAPSLSVIIPARNEKGNMLPALQRMPRFEGALEVIFVEGHSKDGTWEEIQRVAAMDWPFTVKTFQQTGKGKNDAVRLGFDKASNDILMILDADLTVMPEELPRFYQILADRRAEYVHGTRLVYPMENQAMRPLNWLGNKFFSAVLSYLVGQPLSDTLCGTKCMYKKSYERLVAGRTYFGDFDPFGDFDLIFGASKLSLKISEIPVHYKNRTYGSTQINRFRDGWILIKMCVFAARKMLFL